MTLLTFEPGVQSLEYSFFKSGIRPPFRSGRIQGFREPSDESHSQREALRTIAWRARPDLIAIRAPFGGTEFTGPALASRSTLERLGRLVEGDPLHIPPIIALAEACADAFPGARVVLVFETAFFARLDTLDLAAG